MTGLPSGQRENMPLGASKYAKLCPIEKNVPEPQFFHVLLHFYYQIFLQPCHVKDTFLKNHEKNIFFKNVHFFRQRIFLKENCSTVKKPAN